MSQAVPYPVAPSLEPLHPHTISATDLSFGRGTQIDGVHSLAPALQSISSISQPFNRHIESREAAVDGTSPASHRSSPSHANVGNSNSNMMNYREPARGSPGILSPPDIASPHQSPPPQPYPNGQRQGSHPSGIRRDHSDSPHSNLSPPDGPGPSNWVQQQQEALSNSNSNSNLHLPIDAHSPSYSHQTHQHQHQQQFSHPYRQPQFADSSAAQLSQQMAHLGQASAAAANESPEDGYLGRATGLGGSQDEDDAMDGGGQGNATSAWVAAQQMQQRQSPSELHASRQPPLIDGRGNGDVVMQNVEHGSLSQRPQHHSPSAHTSSREHLQNRYSDGRLGVLAPDAPRSYTAIKLVGDGSFGTVWLCDWHSPLNPETMLSAMQCGAGARSEWVGKRLVAVKRMKRVWEGGWAQASKLGELVSLREIQPHSAIIPLYDAFLQPDTKELYFVFECMEGNLYQLTKSRKGRPLAGGLVASIFHQMVGGLNHIHRSGYFHRDMKPENLLVTTTGLQEYLPVIDIEREHINAALVAAGKRAPDRPRQRVEKDVTVIVKLADFGLARSLDSKPPYTEYVSTRWYRAPEVLLRSKDYSAPVDMWALGTILAEIINLKALFPGQSEVDQVWRICEVLGDPSDEYGHDSRGKPRGGGEWVRGIKMAKAVGFAFPKKLPVQFTSLFPSTTPMCLIDCISELLRYNPRHRLTSDDCLNHPYFRLTDPHLGVASRLPQVPFSRGQPPLSDLHKELARIEASRAQQQQQSLSSFDSRVLPGSHSASPVQSKPAFRMEDGGRPMPAPDGHGIYGHSARNGAFASSADTLSPLGANAAIHSNTVLQRSHGAATALVEQLRELDLPTADLSTYGVRGDLQAAALQEAASRHSHQSQWSAKTHPYGNLQHGSTPEIPQVYNLPKRHFESQPSLGVSSTSPFRNPENDDAVPPLPSLPAHMRSHLPPHMSSPTALASPDQARWHQEESHAPTMPARGDVAMHESQTHAAVQSPNPINSSVNLPISGKKKKWGLSSVFGGGAAESTAELGPPPAANIASASSLARLNASTLDLSPTTSDPKKVRREAERQSKELEKAKREAAERAQKERARAVMQKRTQLEHQRRQHGTKGELEWGSDAANASRQNLRNASQIQLQYQPSQQHIPEASSVHLPPGGNAHNSTANTEYRHPYGVGMGQPTQSSTSVLSNQRSSSGEFGADAMRSKARRRDDDGDHSKSVSRIDMSAVRNPSLMTIETIDSDPGPRSNNGNSYPASVHHAASVSSLNVRHPWLGSSASLDGQLARDFRLHANVRSNTQLGPNNAGGQGHVNGSASSLSLGQYATSTASLSGPTTPYGNPLGHAVAGGYGLGRTSGMLGQTMGQKLPSIADWEQLGSEVPIDSSNVGGSVNPMFRVSGQANYPQQGNGSSPEESTRTSLPPFSAIASVAGSIPRNHNNRGERQ